MSDQSHIAFASKAFFNADETRRERRRMLTEAIYASVDDATIACELEYGRKTLISSGGDPEGAKHILRGLFHDALKAPCIDDAYAIGRFAVMALDEELKSYRSQLDRAKGWQALLTGEKEVWEARLAALDAVCEGARKEAREQAGD